MLNKFKRSHILIALGIVSLVTLFSFQNCSTVQKNSNIDKKALIPVEQHMLPTVPDVSSEKPENLNDLIQQSESEVNATREKMNFNNVNQTKKKIAILRLNSQQLRMNLKCALKEKNKPLILLYPE